MRVGVDGIVRSSSMAVPIPQVVGIPSPRRQITPLAGTVGLDGIRRHSASEPLVDAVVNSPTATVQQDSKPLSIPYKVLVVITIAFLAMITTISLVRSSVIGLISPAQTTVPTQTSAAATTAAPTAVAPLPDTITPILQGFTTKYGAPSGIAVINLKTGQSFGSSQNQVFTSASLYKLFVAESVYRAIDAGTIQSSQTVPGTGKSVASCLNLMITISDNPCGVALGNLVGWERQNDRLHQLGFNNTLLRRNDSEQTSAGDVALLLKRLYDGTLLSPASSQSFLDLLKAQKINNRLPQGLPAGTVIAHKTGDLDGLVHDAGIVYSPAGDYIISIMTGPWKSAAQAPSAFADLSRSVFETIQKP